MVVMARVLGVSRSGFYEWCGRRANPSSGQARRIVLDACVAAAFRASKQRHGASRLVDDLRDVGTPANRKAIAESLRGQGLRARVARKFKAQTSSDPTLPYRRNCGSRTLRRLPRTSGGVGDIA
ncbi:MAG: hypothetical protein IT466_09285 [Moraxellaceae bacterium]|nr:hypothetical protein [Moraxellaceae bacterium]